MAIREAIRRSRYTGTRHWSLPEHFQALSWPVNGYEPEVSWPAWTTLTPAHFVQRWGWQAAPAITPQFLRDVYEFIQDEELGRLRWYEEPFYAVHYWREASAWPEPPPGLLSQLIELLRRAFVAVKREDADLQYFNIYGQQVGDVDIPVGALGPPGPPGPPGQSIVGPAGRRGTLWFVGHGDPSASVPANAQERDLYLDVDTGNIWQLDLTRRWRRIT